MIPSSILKSVSKPARYIGGEVGSIIKNKDDVTTRFAFCFPDTYEIGMSNLGMRILYNALNQTDGVWCERVYAPWLDMQEKMQEHNIPLYALESGDPVSAFDIVAFTLQYELCYSTVLSMLKLAGLPFFAKDRTEDMPIILGGGPCAYNPEPIADFFDIFSIGEGEEALPELCRLYQKMKRENNYTKADFLHEAAKIEGFYVPSLYTVSYDEKGSIASFTPKYMDIPSIIRKRIIEDFNKAPFPETLVMPYTETVHDRVQLEIFRGCIRGCRFCQAGMVYRPIREKTPETLCKQARCLYESTGYDEMSLISLSISDYSELERLTEDLLSFTDDAHVSLSLPSLRMDSFSEELMRRISSVRSGGLTFAPEAGTQRLRDVINKNITEQDLEHAASIAFAGGKSSVKLYFMNGLPTETEEDIKGIAQMAEKVIDVYYHTPNRNKARPVSVTISVACFIPKPFTPFQWDAQDSMENLEEKQQLLKSSITNRKIRYNYHDAKVSFLEAVFARGNRKLSRAIAEAANRGIVFDAWNECFSYDKWMDVFKDTDIDPTFYANRAFGEEEILPWDMIDIGVSKAFLLKERKKGYADQTTPNCSELCSGCGASKLGGQNKWCK